MLQNTSCNKLRNIGIAFIAGKQTHIGILYKDDDKINILDLCFHHKLRNEAITKDYLWGDCPWIIDENAIVLTARLLSISPETKIPYGFKHENVCFDRNLKYVPIRIGQGLTCASFVLVIFKSLDYNLIDFESWKNRDDDEDWQRKIIEQVRCNDREQAEAMENTIGAFRYRPEEVAAAALSEDIPLSFEEAVAHATILLQEISRLDEKIDAPLCDSVSKKPDAANTPSTAATQDAPGPNPSS